MINEQRINEEDLESALRALAILIQNYGPKYWPIFDRIDKELEQVRARQCKLSAALDV